MIARAHFALIHSLLLLCAVLCSTVVVWVALHCTATGGADCGLIVARALPQDWWNGLRARGRAHDFLC
jgi:hypothetical protein